MIRAVIRHGREYTILIYFLVLLSLLHPSDSKVADSSLSPSLVKSRSKVSLPQQIKPQPQNVVQIVESEEYDGKTWLGHKSRWSDADGEECDPPPSTNAPEGFQFEGDWKIVTSANRDSLGWEYIWALNQPAMRKRLWLRTIVLIPKQPPTSLVATLRDQWNFKGFGVSFYKSLTFAKSFGMAFRLPIASNIEWWERNPALPSFSTAVAAYFPFTAIYQISGSLNVDFLAWVLGRSIRYAIYGASVVLLAICQMLFLPLALLLYPARRQLILPTFPLPTIPTAPPIFSLTISQRLGMSVNWRFTWESGCELRITYYYECMPTVLYLTELLHRNINNFQMMSNSNYNKNVAKEFSDTKLTNWLRRKAAAFGLSCGAPLPVPPHYFCTAALSMSGFYFSSPKQQQQQNKQQATVPSILTATATSKEDLAIESSSEAEESSAIKKAKVSSAAA